MTCYQQTDDWMLLNRIRQDPDCLQELFLRHRDYVYRLAWSLLRDPANAEDATQDVFCRLAASRRRFQQRAAFRTWLYRVTVNCVHDQRRRQPRVPEWPAAELPTTAATAETGADLERVLTALEELPERQQQVLVLRLFEGFSVAETARAVGCGQGSVKTHLHRATQKLKEKFKQVTTTGD